MKKSMIVLIAVLLVLVLAVAFAACNKEHVHSDADGDEFCDDCGAFIGGRQLIFFSSLIQLTFHTYDITDKRLEIFSKY